MSYYRRHPNVVNLVHLDPVEGTIPVYDEDEGAILGKSGDALRSSIGVGPNDAPAVNDVIVSGESVADTLRSIKKLLAVQCMLLGMITDLDCSVDDMLLMVDSDF